MDGFDPEMNSGRQFEWTRVELQTLRYAILEPYEFHISHRVKGVVKYEF